MPCGRAFYGTHPDEHEDLTSRNGRGARAIGATVAPAVRRSGVVIPLALLLASCGETAAPVGPDATVPADRPPVVDAPSPTADTDGDGLCDLTERDRRTDPTNPDTDGDGLLDSFEVRAGDDPLSGRSPAATNRIAFTEGDTTRLAIVTSLDYQGAGESLLAAMQNRTRGVDDLDASDLVDFTLTAVSANPAAFVGALMGPRFVGVAGRAVLTWQLDAQLRAAGDGGVMALGCRRAYEATLTVKRVGDDVVAARPVVVDVAPAAGATASWPRVSREGFCLPARCF